MSIRPSIHCVHNNDSSVGFGFFNMSHLVINNLDLFGCGAIVTSQAVRIFNDTHPHLGVGQKAVMVLIIVRICQLYMSI